MPVSQSNEQGECARGTITDDSCVELLRNMQDEIWAFKIHSCGQVERIWEALTKVRGEGDEVRKCHRHWN